VTLAVWLSRRGKISGVDAIIYVIVQVLAAFVAGLFYWFIKDDTFAVMPGSCGVCRNACGVRRAACAHFLRGLRRSGGRRACPVHGGGVDVPPGHGGAADGHHRDPGRQFLLRPLHWHDRRRRSHHRRPYVAPCPTRHRPVHSHSFFSSYFAFQPFPVVSSTRPWARASSRYASYLF